MTHKFKVGDIIKRNDESDLAYGIKLHGQEFIITRIQFAGPEGGKTHYRYYTIQAIAYKDYLMQVLEAPSKNKIMEIPWSFIYVEKYFDLIGKV
jgi:hypothetical protein